MLPRLPPCLVLSFPLIFSVHDSLRPVVMQVFSRGTLRNRVVGGLPLHLVGLVALAEAEGGRQVAGEQVDLLDVGDQGLVNGLLVGGAAAAELLLL
jgi:hypothetical protein